MVTHLLSALFLLAAAVAAAVAVQGWRRRGEAPGFGAMAMLAVGITQWSVADAIAIQFRDPDVVLGFLGSSFIGVCVVVAAWHFLSLATVDVAWRPTWRSLWLAVEPVLCLLAIATNPWHGQFFLRAEATGFDGAIVPVFGPLFWLHTVYSYALLILAVGRMVRAWARASGGYKGYLVAIVIATPSAVFNIIGLSLNGRVIDLTAIGFAVTAPLMYWVITRLSLPALAPVAHQRVFQKISDAVAVVNRSGMILDVNAAAERLLRELSPDAPDRLIGAPLKRVLGPTHQVGPLFRLTDGVDVEHTLENANGSGIDLNVRVSSLFGHGNRPVGWALVARDITDLNRHRRDLESANRQLREQLHTIELLRNDLAEQAVRDHLTGLHNRRYLMSTLAAAVGQATAQHAPLSVALIDIDHFKTVNDRYGHAAGDAVLVHFAALLAGAVGPQDVVARHGGEEFVLLFPDATEAEAVARVDSLRTLVRGESVLVDGRAVRITFSAGVASFSGAERPPELLHAADQALYAAKQGGRDRVEPAIEHSSAEHADADHAGAERAGADHGRNVAA